MSREQLRFEAEDLEEVITVAEVEDNYYLDEVVADILRPIATLYSIAYEYPYVISQLEAGVANLVEELQVQEKEQQPPREEASTS